MGKPSCILEFSHCYIAVTTFIRSWGKPVCSLEREDYYGKESYHVTGEVPTNFSNSEQWLLRSRLPISPRMTQRWPKSLGKAKCQPF